MIITPYRYIARFIAFCASNFNEFLDKNGPYMAAAIAFYALFSIFPLMLALVTVFGFFLGIEDFNQRLVEALESQVPVLKESGGVILEVLNNISTQRVVSSVLAVLGLLWISSGVFGSVRKSVNTIWGIKRTRSFVHERLIDFTLLFGATSILFASLYTTVLLGFVQSNQSFMVLGAQASGPLVSRLLATVIPPILSFGAFFVIYWWLPNTKIRLRDAAPTALAGALAFEAAKQSFVYYLREIGGPNDIYGAMGAVIILMAWVYVSAIILLGGAQLTARYTSWVARAQQHRHNRLLSANLERVRMSRSLPGIHPPAP
ncbi:MAG: YihY/virulence factor BrkB family protein [Dehalococcoidia bacterium]|nr:YihY/virulence factor BrkB family protein [Dehalococcoidia bacterium]MSQ34333.1 YihY/virulence factor BrkB family protein [Dehalococcoidia bacterium]